MSHSLMFLTPFSVLLALLTLSMQRNHLLMALLTLEAMILMLTLMMASFTMLLSPSELVITLIMLTFGACEASLGLACLVALSRMHGNDMCSMMAMTKW
uniref:NADH dehydrogenase subunit 4L n=1 Tax=Micronephthys minuta TaxID=1037237 RepID=UPI0030E36237